MSKNNKEDERGVDELLKKIESQTAEQKKQEVMRILTREEKRPSPVTSLWQTLTAKVNKSFQQRKRQIIRQSKIGQNKHIAIITLFFCGAIWASYEIETKYDKIRRRAQSTKSLKTRQVEAQNEYIQKMLARNPFEPVPIEQQNPFTQNYIYEKTDLEFNTKADLIEAIERDREILCDDQIEQL